MILIDCRSVDTWSTSCPRGKPTSAPTTGAVSAPSRSLGHRLGFPQESGNCGEPRVKPHIVLALFHPGAYSIAHQIHTDSPGGAGDGWDPEIQRGPTRAAVHDRGEDRRNRGIGNEPSGRPGPRTHAAAPCDVGMRGRTRGAFRPGVSPANPWPKPSPRGYPQWDPILISKKPTEESDTYARRKLRSGPCAHFGIDANPWPVVKPPRNNVGGRRK